MYLTEMRSKCGLSQYRLSKLSGVSQPHISDIESGKKSPTLAVLEKLANAMKITVSQLISGCDDEVKSA